MSEEDPEVSEEHSADPDETSGGGAAAQAQGLAIELIGGLRRLLDVAEAVVRDPAAAKNFVQTAAVVGKAFVDNAVPHPHESSDLRDEASPEST